MSKFNFQLINQNDSKEMELISEWYFEEWKIPKEKTIQKLKTLFIEKQEFQILMKIGELPIATGGIFTHVGILDKLPRLKIYKNWLALVFTIPEQRKKGFGEILCKQIESNSKKIGLNEIYLFTDTAESLYIKLGWKELERVNLDNRNIVIMKKTLG